MTKINFYVTIVLLKAQQDCLHVPKFNSVFSNAFEYAVLVIENFLKNKKREEENAYFFGFLYRLFADF